MKGHGFGCFLSLLWSCRLFSSLSAASQVERFVANRSIFISSQTHQCICLLLGTIQSFWYRECPLVCLQWFPLQFQVLFVSFGLLLFLFLSGEIFSIETLSPGSSALEDNWELWTVNYCIILAKAKQNSYIPLEYFLVICLFVCLSVYLFLRVSIQHPSKTNRKIETGCWIG